MLTVPQTVVVLAAVASGWTSLGALSIMQWQLQRYVETPFKLRLSPKEARDVVQTHARIFPGSVLRKVCACGLCLFGVTAIAAVLAFAR
jgi:hypothetical protein